MKVFTIRHGVVEKGAAVDKLTLKAAGVVIPAVIIGEEGRGRVRGVLPVSLLPGERNTYLFVDVMKELPVIKNAVLGTTKTGKPKLIETASDDGSDSCIVVLRTHMGYRGGNSNTGDRNGWVCRSCGAKGTDVNVPEICPVCGESKTLWGSPVVAPDFLPFPGEVIVEGRIAEGDAGYMGHGQQLIAVMPANTVFRTAYYGRLYGAPPSHYYKWDGNTLLGGITWDERLLSDVF